MSQQPTASKLGEAESKAMTFFADALRRMVFVSTAIAAASLLTMMLVTCADVFLRKLGHPLTGAYELVKIAAGLTCACALPYTTAIKGHVAVEFFYHRLGRRGRVVADTFIRLIIMALFIQFTWHLLQFGARLRSSGEVSMTLQIPLFWVPYIMACACALVVLITLYHLLHPGKALISLK